MSNQRGFAPHFTLTIFPSTSLAAISSVGLCADLALHAANPGSILRQELPVSLFSIAAILWFWVTFAWIVFGASRALDWLANTCGRFTASVASLAVSAVLSFGLLFYIGSWLMNLQIGRFATVDIIPFLFSNPLLSTWDHMGRGERIASAIGVIALPVLTLLLIRLLKMHASVSIESRVRDLRASWVLVFIVLLGSWIPIGYDLSAHRFATRTEGVRSRLHPAITAAASTYDMVAMESIKPILDVSALTKLDFDWAPTENGKKPSVIFVAIEALRSDIVGLEHQGREVAPNLNRLASAGLNWTRAYAQSTHSDYADVCIVSSLYPLRTRRHHYYRSDDPWPKTLAFDLFKQAGYATAVMSSQNESWGGMDQFLQVPSLDLFFDSARSNLPTHTSWRDPGFAIERAVGAFNAGSLRDDQTMDHTIDWIDQQLEDGTPYFVSMNLQSSHFPYEMSDKVERPFQPARLDSDVTFMYHPPEKTHLVRNCYLNAVHNCDKELGRLIEHLRKKGTLDDTLIVVLGENGEAFHENGSVGHAREPVEPAVHVTTVFHAPNFIKPTTDNYPLEHVDLLPTILGIVGWPQHPNLQGQDLLDSERPDLSERLVFHHVNSGAARADAVQWRGRWKLVLDRRSATEKLFDLANDPSESADLHLQYPSVTEGLRNVLTQWHDSQLSYYRYSRYYNNYCPPQAPRLSVESMAKMDRELSEAAE